ncbi:hypothetical protein DRQ50_10635 [bacterium]|nr:MAG: hypothetical protein DRQ50_10635 [bacterium]
MHVCLLNTPCQYPVISRYSVAIRSAREEAELAHERAEEAWRLFGARPLSGGQVQQMAVSLAMAEAADTDAPCLDLRRLVRAHLKSPELALLAACLQGQVHVGAWAELVRRLSSILEPFCLPPNLHSEVLSTAFLSLRMRALWRFSNRRELDAFLVGVVRNTIRRCRPRFRFSALPADHPSPLPAPEEIAARRELAALAKDAVDDLPPRQRLALEMRMNGATYREIAAKAGLQNRKTASRQVMRTLNALEHRLSVR